MSLIYRPEGEALEYAYYGIGHYVGCAHGCTYCYMRKIFNHYHLGDFDTPKLKSFPVDFIKKLSREAGRFKDKKKRVHLCFTTDPYQPIDAEYKLTRAVIEVLRECEIPFQILTKAGDLAQRDFDLYGPEDLFGVTLTQYQADEMTEEIEPNAASPAQRMANLKAAYEHGIKTWVSLEPVIWPADSLTIIRKTAAFTNLYKIGKMNHVNSITNDLYTIFARDAVKLCDELGVKYYLKDNLAKLLPAGSYHNTDARIVDCQL